MNQQNTAAAGATSYPGWHGSLKLDFGYRQGKTELIQDRIKAPLKVQRPFYPEGEEVCHSVILHTAGGIVGGDRLTVDINLQPHAQALITSAAAGKVYCSNGLEAQQTIVVQIAEGACLEWFPQETIVFEGAIYRQNLRVELANDATWMGWEITRFGRSARGEKFLQGNWRSHTEVWQDGNPLWIDRQWMKGGEDRFNSPHGLGGYPVVGSFFLVGKSVSPEIVEKARSLSTSRQGETGVTTLLKGLLCRYRGKSTQEARRWFVDVWQLLRLSYLQRPACSPRVWQM